MKAVSSLERERKWLSFRARELVQRKSFYETRTEYEKNAYELNKYTRKLKLLNTGRKYPRVSKRIRM